MRVRWCSEDFLARLTLFLLLVGLWLASILPLSRGMAVYVEEAAGLVTVLPNWADEVDRDGVPFAGGQLITSRRQPVAGILTAQGDFTPWMVDGHIGATSFLPYRWALQLGGLDAARGLSVATGVAVMAGMLQLGGALGSSLAGWLTLILLATSTQFLFIYQWVRPDEHWTWAMPLFAVLAAIRHAKTQHRRWLVVAGLCLGLAVAAKSTAIIVVGSLVVATFGFRMLRHLKWRDTVVLGLSALPPILPQAMWTAFGNHEALDSRFAGLPSPRTLLDPDRLWFFLMHFFDSFGGLGTYIAGAFVDQQPDPGAIGRLSGVVVLAGFAAFILLTLRKSTPRPQRALGFALATTSAAYLAIYYQGMSLYLLLTPWVPLAVGLILAQLWTPGRLVVARRVVVVGVMVLLCGNGLAQTRILHRMVAHPQLDIVALGAQQALAAALVAGNVVAPWTSTHNIVGALEVLTAAQVRPHHAFAMFLAEVVKVGETSAGYDAAWDRVLAFARATDAAAGRSDFVLQPAASKMDVSPLKHRRWLEASFADAVQRQGGVISAVREFRAQPGGPVLLKWATVQWPAHGP
jgi:hypothetical protein